MNVVLKIGEQYFNIEQPIEFPWEHDAAIFRVNDLPQDAGQVIRCCIGFVEEFAPIWGRVVHADNGMMVMETCGKELRVFTPANGGDPYAISWMKNENSVQVLIDIKVASKMHWGRGMLGLLPLEHICLDADSFLLHASCIIYRNEAIVFTAPSGTGKSTQADLWKDYAGARVINGDRTLLFCRNGRWFACGFPVCGSSPYCCNEEAPVRAIVCLGQAKQNMAERLSDMHAVQKIYSQAFVNTWNPADISKVIDLVQSLSRAVSVWKYDCTQETDAVEILKEKIYTLK